MPAASHIAVLGALASSAALLVSAQGTGTATQAPSRTSSRTFTPLAAKTFSYPDEIPYQVDTDNGPRGTQQGYNLCNSTTEGQESMCQTAFINSIEDFCLWAPPEPNSIVGDTEGEMVAWCTQPGRGTRLIPAGALQGVQFTRTPSYIQVVGFIDQRQINIGDGDYGGEMDPHGADQRGNPLGGLMFTQQFGEGRGANASGTTNGTQWTQVMQWHNFMGANMFCLKSCDPADDNDWHYCEHIFDRIGCYYNAPADYGSINGTFTSCDGDNQMFPGVYVNEAGNTVTYTQPPESLGVISTMPYQPSIPSSSQCSTYTSAQLYSALGTVEAAPTSAASSDAVPTVGAAPTTSVSRAAGAANNAAASRPTSSSNTGAASTSVVLSGSAAGLAMIAALAAFF